MLARYRVGWNGASVRAPRQPPARAGSGAAALRRRRAKKLRVGRGHRGHRGRGGLVPRLRGGGGAVVVFSPRLGVPLLLLGVAGLLVLALAQVLLVHAALAVAVEGRRALELAAVAARRAVRGPRAVPARGHGERVGGEVAERALDGDLRAARAPAVVEREERLLVVAQPRVRVVVVLLDVLLEQAVVRDVLLEQTNGHFSFAVRTLPIYRVLARVSVL